MGRIKKIKKNANSKNYEFLANSENNENFQTLFESTFDKIYAEDPLKTNTSNFLKIEIEERQHFLKTRFRKIRYAVIFTALAILLMLSGFSKLYFTPSSYVDIDISPSIELTLNIFNRVIKANPYSEDEFLSNKLESLEDLENLKNINLAHKSYDEAVKFLIDSVFDLGYLDENGLVSITVQTENPSNENLLINGLETAVNASLTTHHSSVQKDIFAVSQVVKHCAHEQNVSPAKYIAITELQKIDPEVSFESCSGHSISEIRRLSEEHGNDHHDNDIDGEDKNCDQENHEIENNYSAENGHENNNVSNDINTSGHGSENHNQNPVEQKKGEHHEHN